MPVEIRELQIVTTVQDSVGTSQGKTAPAPANNDDVVAKCVEQVLEIIREKIER